MCSHCRIFPALWIVLYVAFFHIYDLQGHKIFFILFLNVKIFYYEYASENNMFFVILIIQNTLYCNFLPLLVLEVEYLL